MERGVGMPRVARKPVKPPCGMCIVCRAKCSALGASREIGVSAHVELSPHDMLATGPWRGAGVRAGCVREHAAISAARGGGYKRSVV